MTKATVKFVCGAIMMVVIVCVGIILFSDGKYAWAVFNMVLAIKCAFIMASGYKDLPEK